MARKKSEPEEMESSAEEEEESEGEEAGEETESGNSSEEDEFDSEDERVNTIPGEETVDEAPLQAAPEEDSSSESDESDETPSLPLKPVAASTPQTQQNVRTFDSDVESEYETESSSDSEGLTEGPVKDTVQGSLSETRAAAPHSQKNLQETQIKGKIAEHDQAAKKGKDKAVKQQQKDPVTVKSEDLRSTRDERQPARDDKKVGLLSTKRKVGSLHDVDRDSPDSASVLKKKKDAEVLHDGKKSAATGEAIQTPTDSALDDSSKSKKVIDRDKPFLELAKEIARKTLHSANARENGSQVVFDSKLSSPRHESNQVKKTNNSAATQPVSPSKQKKVPHAWSTGQETVLVSEVSNHMKMGLEVPTKRTDDFWLTLSDVMQEKLHIKFTREQLSDKVRRLKSRYQGMARRIKDFREAKKPFEHKNVEEQRLFDLMSEIWGKAEMVTVEGHQQAVPQQARPGPSKSEQVTQGESKAMSVSSPKARHADFASKQENAGKSADGKADVVVVASPWVEHKILAKEDQGPGVATALVDGTTLSPNDAQRLLENKVHAMLHDLQEWSKGNLEDWMNKVYALIEDSTRKFEEHWRRTSLMRMVAGGSLATSICNPMDFQILHGEDGIHRQWYDLHLQELNVHIQRLELMHRECELKQEQIKAQLHEKS